jgi:hypothetical protein
VSWQSAGSSAVDFGDGYISSHRHFPIRLCLRSFIRVTRGHETGSYVHPLFQRGAPHLCLLMNRIRSRAPQALEPFNPIALGIAQPEMPNAANATSLAPAIPPASASNPPVLSAPMNPAASQLSNALSALDANSTATVAAAALTLFLQQQQQSQQQLMTAQLLSQYLLPLLSAAPPGAPSTNVRSHDSSLSSNSSSGHASTTSPSSASSVELRQTTQHLGDAPSALVNALSYLVSLGAASVNMAQPTATQSANATQLQGVPLPLGNVVSSPASQLEELISSLRHANQFSPQFQNQLLQLPPQLRNSDAFALGTAAGASTSGLIFPLLANPLPRQQEANEHNRASMVSTSESSTRQDRGEQDPRNPSVGDSDDIPSAGHSTGATAGNIREETNES